MLEESDTYCGKYKFPLRVGKGRSELEYVFGEPSRSAELSRRNAHDSPKDFGEMTLVHEPSRLRNLANREVRAPKVYFRSINPAADGILMRAEARAFLEQLAEIMWTHSREFGQLPEPYFACVVLPHEINYAIEPDGRHSAPVFVFSWRSRGIASHEVAS